VYSAGRTTGPRGAAQGEDGRAIVLTSGRPGEVQFHILSCGAVAER
jgi:hypothetical protein